MASTCIDVGDWLSNETATAPSQPCGLFVANSQKPLPLRSRSVTAHVYAEHGFCEVREELAYVADEDCTVRFVFPLPPRSAVFKFKATIGDRQVATEVKRKAAAQEEYDDAVRQGHTAVHMQQQQGASLYSVEVGNLFAMEEAIITFSYVRLLNSVAGAVEFEHQATWVPPYFKASELDAQGNPNSAVAAANPVFADKVSYKLSYHILVQSSRGFRSIESPSPVSISEGEDPNVRIVAQHEQVSDPSRDLTLLIELPPLAENQSHMGQLLVQECERQGGKKNKTVGLATFVPRLPKPAAGHVPQAREIIFVVDGSGSMGGSPIQQALEAALFFVKDLPAAGNITFNAAMFGSGHQMMWPRSKPYNQATQTDAVQWLQANVNANWGGTEVLQVLQLIYDTMPLAAGTSRQIIFLTDGGVSGHEEEAIYSLVQGKSGNAAAKAAAARTSIFSLGIGHGVHRGLVEGVALKTGGLAQFVLDGEPIGRKAGLLKRCALAAEGGCLTKPRLVSRSCMIKAAPNVLPPRLFPDEPLHVLFEVVKAEPGASLELTASAPGSNGQDSPYSIPLSLDQAVRVPGDVLAVLHAMSSIGCLLADTSSLHCTSDGSRHPKQPDARQVEDAVVALAEEEGLVTPYTSAVGVLLQKDPLDPSTVKQVEVPLQVPAGRDMWQGQQQQGQQQQMQQLQTMCAKLSHVGGRGGGCAMACYAAAPMRRCAAPAPAGADMSKMKKSGRGFIASITGGLFGSGAKSAAAPAAPAPAASVCAWTPPPANWMSAPGKGSAMAPAYEESEAEECDDMALDLAEDEPMKSQPMECQEDKRSSKRLQEQLADRSRERSRERESVHAAAAQQQLLPSQVLSLLNLRRTVDGAVLSSPEVLQALASEAVKQQAPALTLAQLAASLMTASARPAALTSDDAWVTLLALAYLRKHLAGEQNVWSGLEAKALEWLSGVWPSAVGRSVGSVVLAAMKLI